MKILKKGRFTLAALIATVICAVVAAFAGIFGGFGASVQTADANAVGSDMYELGSGGSITGSQLARLMGKIMGSSSAKSYNELKAYMDKDSDNARTGTEIDLCVSLGGVYWNVVYASETESGDVIATLWLGSSTDTQKWADYTGSSWEGMVIPAPLYSTSYIRSYLVGSLYATTNSGTFSTTGAQSSTWSTFISQYGNCISAPTEVAYQGGTSSSVNETYGGLTSSTSSNYFNDTGLYGAWQYDKLWLPSAGEIGSSSGVSGLWKLSDSKRANGNNYSWLRTGTTSPVFAVYVNKDGTATSTAVGTNLNAVRPALHLNLKKAAAAAGLFADKPTLSKTSATYATNTEFTLSRDGTAMAVYAPHELSAGVGTQTFIEFKTGNSPAGTYSFVCKLNTGYSWSDGSVGDCILPFVIYPQEISSITWSVTGNSVAYTGSPINITATTPGGTVALPTAVTGDNLNAGSFTVTAFCPNNYKFASNLTTSKTITITKQAISAVEWSTANNSGFEYDTQNHAPTASYVASNGQRYNLPVTLEKDGAPVTSAIDAGTYTATVAAGDYNSNFNLATASTVNFTVNPREVQIDWGAETLAYSGGNRDSDVVLSVSSGLLGSDTLTLNATYVSGDNVNVTDGGFIMEASIDGTSTNYKLPSVKTHVYKITPLTLSGVTAQVDGTYTYNGSIQTPAISLTGGNIVSGDTVAAYVSGGGIDAGTHSATVIGIDNPNYSLDGTITAQFTIAPLDIDEGDIQWSIADGDEFTYNGANRAPEAWFTYNGVTYALTTDLLEAYNASATDYVANVRAGVFQNNFNLVDLDVDDPTGNAASVTFKINKAQITANDVEWSFTEGFKFAPGTDPAIYALFRYNNSAYLLSVTYTDEAGNAVAVGGDGTQWKVGGYTATVALGTGAGFDNFELSGTISRTFKMTDSASGTYTVIWEGFSAVVNYNGADQKPSAYVIVDGEKLDVTVSVEKWDGTAWVAASEAKNAGTYRFTATRTNYALQNDKVECRIDPRVISVDYTNLTGLKHGTTQDVTATTTDPVAKAEMDAGLLNISVSGSGHVAGTHVVSAVPQNEVQGAWVATGNYVISNATAVQTIGKKILEIGNIDLKNEFTYDGTVKVPEGKVKVSALTVDDQAGGAYLIFEFVYAVEAGTYPVKVLGVSNDNYAFAGEITLTINEREISEVKWEGVQNGNTVTYNKQNQAPKPYIVINGEKIYLEGTLEKYDVANDVWNEVAYAINAGEYRVTVEEVPQGTGDYFFQEAQITFTVGKFELTSIYLTKNVFTYDGNTPNIEVYAIGANNERIYITTYKVLDELGTAVTTYPNAGTYIVQVQAGVLGANANYTVKSLTAATFVINPQLVSVSFEITGNSWSWKVDVSTVPTVTVKANVANAIEVRYGKLGADNTKPESSNHGLSYSFNVTGMTGDGIITVVAVNANYQITGASVQTFNVIPIDGEAQATFIYDGAAWGEDNLQLTYDAENGTTFSVTGDNDVIISYYKDGVLLSDPITTTAGLDAGTYLITVNCPTRELTTNVTSTSRTFTILPQEVDFSDVQWQINGAAVSGASVQYNGQIYSASLNLGDLADDFDVYYTNGALKNVGGITTVATVVPKNKNYTAANVTASYAWTIEEVAASVAWNEDGTVAAISGDCAEATGGSFFVKEGAAYKVVYKKGGVVLDGAPNEEGDYTAEVVLALGNDDNVTVTAQSFSFKIEAPAIGGDVGDIGGNGDGILSSMPDWAWYALLGLALLAILLAIIGIIVASKKKALIDEDGFYDDVTEDDLK